MSTAHRAAGWPEPSGRMRLQDYVRGFDKHPIHPRTGLAEYTTCSNDGRLLRETEPSRLGLENISPRRAQVGQGFW